MTAPEASTVEVGAYFYPLTRQCPHMAIRAKLLGEELGLEAALPTEQDLARDATPLFDGHDQPRTYCITGGEQPQTRWDDGAEHNLHPQLALAASHGLSHFIFNSYTGVRQQQPNYEMAEVRDNFSRQAAQLLGSYGLKFARMETLESSRVLLPIPYGQPMHHEYFANFREPDRQFDITPETARLIVDDAARDWQASHYLRVAGRPYLSILMPPLSTEEARRNTMSAFTETIYQYAQHRYDQIPYLVGVMRQPSDVETWAKIGVDGITQYCHLANPGEPIQDYTQLAVERKRDWQTFHDVARRHNIPFIPSPAIGWDASPRGEKGHSWEEIAGVHPYTPIVVNNTPLAVANMLRAAIDSTKKNVPEGQRFVTMFAWNEITEGATLLPRLLPDGSVDKSLLEAVREVIRAEAKPTPLFAAVFGSLR